MPANLPHAATSDDARTRVQLDELVAMRLRVARHGMRLVAANAVTAAGNRAGHRRGRGMDYLESRIYQPGDDVRHLDWRLTARSGQLHTKVFQEEHEQRVMLLVDCNASMHFGTRGRFKSVQAARIAALLAWHAVRAGGRIGALAFGPCREGQGAAAGSRGALAVCGALVRWDGAVSALAGESLSTALQRLRPLLRGASHAVLITDGRNGDSGMRAALAACRRHARLSVLLVVDPFESGMPPQGRFPLDCAGVRVTANLVDARVREQFHATLAAPAQRMREVCRKLAVPCRQLDTRADPLDALDAITSPAQRGPR